MPAEGTFPDVCEQIKECNPEQPKTKADWISWAAIVLNAVFTITAFWWSQRNEAQKKYRCLHFLAVEFDHVMHMIKATVQQCELVLDKIVDSSVVPLADSAATYANVFHPSTTRAIEARRRDDVGLKSAIQVRNLRVRALCDGARRLKDEADVLCKITRSSEDRRHVQRLIECLATITYIDPAITLSEEDPSYVSRLVTRDLAADLLRSGRRVLAICCRRLETHPHVLRRLSGYRMLLSREQRQSFEIWEKYTAPEDDCFGQACMAPERRKASRREQAKTKNTPIKAFEASIPTLSSLSDIGRTVFNDEACISEKVVGALREVHSKCGEATVPAIRHAEPDE